MKNLKKLFASVTTLAMLSTLAPVATLGASYSSELEGAYDYAYGIGITTQSSIDSANMYGDLTRAAMAKMMANYAKEVLGKTPDTSKSCSFSDVTSSLGDLEASITEACQLGIMGVNMTKFNPQGKVTRGEFGTALSRVLWGEANNGGEPFYANHLSALKEAGVMTNISNPSAKEVRGYVMLMMQRADESNVADSKPAVCSTAENTLACSLGLDTCPAECKETVKEETEVKAGSLTVSLGSSNLSDGSEIPSTGTVRFATVKVKAGSSDSISIKSVEIKKLGLASIPTSTRVWFEKDGIRISGKAAFTSEGSAVISFAPAFVVKASASEELELYVELATAANSDFQFTSVNVNSTASNVGGDFTTPRLRTANYTVAPVDFTAASATGSANVTENGMEIGAFKIENKDNSSDTRDVKVKSVTLRQNGTANLSNLSDIVLERNGEVVAKNPVINSRDITFSISDTIKDGTSATYYIKATVNNVERDTDTYQFELRNTTDLNVVETNTSFRSTVNGGSTNAVSLFTYSIKGGEMTFARDSATSLSANYAAGSDVVLMKGTIASKSAITLEDPTVNISTLGTGLDRLFSTIYLQIGNSTFSYTPKSTDLAGSGLAFLGAATVNGTANVKMYAKLKDTAPATTVKVEDLKLGSFAKKEYVSNGYTVSTAVGSISAVSVTSQTATLNVTKTDAIGNSSIAKGMSNLLVYGIQLSSTQGNGVTVTRADFTITGNTVGTTGYVDNAFLTLYINGSAVSSKTVGSTSTVSFDGFNKTISTTAPMTMEIKATFAEAFSAGTFQATLSSLNAYDKLTSVTMTGYTKPAGAVFTINTATATLAASNEAPSAQLLLSPSLAQKVAAFKVSAANDSVRLYNVVITGAGFDKLSNFKLADLSGNVIATATTTSGTEVKFSEIAGAPYVAKDKSASYYVIADVNSNTSGAVTSLNIDVAQMDLKSSNGTDIDAIGSSVTARAIAIAENTAIFAKQINSDKSVTTSALKFSVTASGKTSVTITGLNISVGLGGYSTGAGSQVVVYKNSISNDNIAFTGTIGNNIVIPAVNAANTVVDAGSTPVVYIVAIEGILVSGTSTDWNVSLKDAYIGGINVATYSNLGSLPMTEVK